MDPETAAEEFTAAVNSFRWNLPTSSPKEDRPWVIDYYDKFFFNYSTIFYTRSDETGYWIDSPLWLGPPPKRTAGEGDSRGYQPTPPEQKLVVWRGWLKSERGDRAG